MNDDQPEVIVPINDFHRMTVYRDETLHAYMDAMARQPDLTGVSRTWRNWGFRRVRMYAKRWNFGKLYGAGPITRLSFPEPKDPIP